ncbi:MAG: hypothetical protein LBB45_00955 [Methanobrevibacter sp.]|jgi:hypothetical protein|nr:hypothetical protein [Candidatus Methanovirga basalitermitum]
MNETKSPIISLSDDILKSSLFFEKEICYLKNTVSPALIPQLREITRYDFEVRYFHPDIIYPVCDGKFNRNGSNQVLINNLQNVRKQKYIMT